MKKLFYLLLLMLPLLQGCSKKPKTNWAPTLNHEAKAPYDTWLAFETLPYYFPQAKCEAISRSFRYSSIDARMMQPGEDSVSLLVMAGLNYYISDEEWERIKLFARAGNEVLIICSKLDNKMETELKCSKLGGTEEQPLNQYNDGTGNKKVLSIFPDLTRQYGYTGRSLEGFFTVDDSTNSDQAATLADSATLTTYAEANESPQETVTIFNAPEVLGYTSSRANFIRYSAGSGHITIHAAPLAFSNYFLLQDSNRAYLDAVWHTFPDNISHVYWNDYYKRTTEKSSINVLWRYPATRWALIIALVTLLMYVLLGLKRRQRIIPIVKPLENASVSFVETIGRLYYNKGNHANLAEKMIQHFMEWVRTYYYLDTSMLNDTFVQQLVSKSGMKEATVRKLVMQIHDIRLGTATVTPEYLYALHSTIQSFYNNQRS